MADCYIVRRGGTGGGKDSTDIYLPMEIYQQGELYDTTPADNISVVDLSKVITIDNFTANSAVKIYGGDKHSITYGWIYTVNVPENSDNLYELFIGVSAEGSTYDLAYVDVNGIQIGSYTTSSGTLKTYSIPLDLVYGDNTVTVKYKKDSSDSKGDDAVYIYGIGYGKLVV